MFVEVFLTRESLARVALAVEVWAVELFSRTLLILSAVVTQVRNDDKYSLRACRGPHVHAEEDLRCR